MKTHFWRTRNSSDPTHQECQCPYCNLHVGCRIQHVIEFEYLTCERNKAFYVLECPLCGRPIIYRIYGSKTHPSGKPLKTIDHLPEKIAAVYDEINVAIGAGCSTAAVILARTAINHVAVDKGADENKKFQYYVEYLVNNHFVPPNAHGWVDKIRLMANESVHDLEVWQHNDAVTIGNFLMYLLVFCYELPASI